ncbi:hypothetical protein M422DRAFT_40855 [Sphaerobolus stellatus SS14]|nr:hypothetical protein M422DRAFT_40855 [Sphaerobolus stellatus SS14]
MTRLKEAKHHVVPWNQVQKNPTLYYSPEQLPPQLSALMDPAPLDPTREFSPSFTFLLELSAVLTSPTKKVDPITRKKDAITLLREDDRDRPYTYEGDAAVEAVDVVSKDEEEPDEGDCVGEPAVSINNSQVAVAIEETVSIQPIAAVQENGSAAPLHRSIHNGSASGTFKEPNQPDLPQGKRKAMASDMDTVQRDVPRPKRGRPKRGRPIGSGRGGNTRASRGDRGGNKRGKQ